jgi:hypothetical protein
MCAIVGKAGSVLNSTNKKLIKRVSLFAPVTEKNQPNLTPLTI